MLSSYHGKKQQQNTIQHAAFQRCPEEKNFWKYATYLPENTHAIKLLCNFIEIRLRRDCSPVNLQHILWRPTPKNSPGKLLLTSCIILRMSCLLWNLCHTWYLYDSVSFLSGLILFSLNAALRKKCPYWELFWHAFSRIRTEYWEILLLRRDTPCGGILCHPSDLMPLSSYGAVTIS